jgi:KamA family protein
MQQATLFAERYQPVTIRNMHRTPFWEILSPELREGIQVVAQVLPFRSNAYVVNELIDWERVPDDPMFQLNFPQRGMLDAGVYDRIRDLLRRDDKDELVATVRRARLELNPHPAGQLTHNVPTLDGRPVPGLQHKYRETVLFFPARGQTCHAYCTYCFRWAQFVDLPDLHFQARETADLVAYLRAHPEVSDVLITGGDPMIMKTKTLRSYIEPLLDPALAHVRHIRIGTKSLSYWPHRYVTDDDADDTLRLFEEVVKAGRHLAIMAHYSHAVELSTPIAQQALRRVRATGAEVRAQAPLIRHVNDDPSVWSDLWRAEVRLGAVPYYMFVERDTGARGYFEVPLARAHQIFQEAYRHVTGLARTVRGPSMSAFPGKIRILGVARVAGRRVFILDFLQARRADWVRRPFFARYDPNATWFDQLRPAFGRRFFFSDDLDRLSVA